MSNRGTAQCRDLVEAFLDHAGRERGGEEEGMSNLHYFHRYSQKENVVTNNTLLLLSRLYAHNALYFEAFLADLLGADAPGVGRDPRNMIRASHRSLGVDPRLDPGSGQPRPPRSPCSAKPP